MCAGGAAWEPEGRALEAVSTGGLFSNVWTDSEPPEQPGLVSRPTWGTRLVSWLCLLLEKPGFLFLRGNRFARPIKGAQSPAHQPAGPEQQLTSSVQSSGSRRLGFPQRHRGYKLSRKRRVETRPGLPPGLETFENRFLRPWMDLCPVSPCPPQGVRFVPIYTTRRGGRL